MGGVCGEAGVGGTGVQLPCLSLILDLPADPDRKQIWFLCGKDTVHAVCAGAPPISLSPQAFLHRWERQEISVMLELVTGT